VVVVPRDRGVAEVALDAVDVLTARRGVEPAEATSPLLPPAACDPPLGVELRFRLREDEAALARRRFRGAAAGLASRRLTCIALSRRSVASADGSSTTGGFAARWVSARRAEARPAAPSTRNTEWKEPAATLTTLSPYSDSTTLAVTRCARCSSRSRVVTRRLAAAAAAAAAGAPHAPVSSAPAA